ncbi:MAG: hypothetical protein K5871_04430 [Lachnospiraceae bacterium]|nr:hypothetical protein [Lachnospiraceae bacterium]
MNDNKFRQMVFYILIGILAIGLISAISRLGNETLIDYAQNNPETAYAQTDNSWKDAYISAPAEDDATDANVPSE